jgi:hypothetical protein
LKSEWAWYLESKYFSIAAGDYRPTLLHHAAKVFTISGAFVADDAVAGKALEQSRLDASLSWQELSKSNDILFHVYSPSPREELSSSVFTSLRTVGKSGKLK